MSAVPTASQDRNEFRRRRQQLRADNQNFGEQFEVIPRIQWRPSPLDHTQRIAVYRNRHFLVQVFQEERGLRVSVNRTDICGDGRWKDGITWDEMFKIKNACGFSDKAAIEIYPREEDLVNVANVRHLWIPDEPIKLGWTKKQSP